MKQRKRHREERSDLWTVLAAQQKLIPDLLFFVQIFKRSSTDCFVVPPRNDTCLLLYYFKYLSNQLIYLSNRSFT